MDFNFKKLILFYNKNIEVFYNTTYCKGNNCFYSYPKQFKKDEKIIKGYLQLNQLVNNLIHYKTNKSDNISFKQGVTEVILKHGIYISGFAIMTHKQYDARYASREKEKYVSNLFKDHIGVLIRRLESGNWQDLRAGKKINVDKRELTQNLADILNP